MSSDIKCTLYVSNLNDKLRRKEMKRQLYYLFTTYGRVTELILLPGMRGQAYVVLQEPAMALHALKSINEFTFFGKPLKVQFAHRESKALAERYHDANNGPKRGLSGVVLDDIISDDEE